MTLFVYKLLRQAKLFCNYCINEDIGIQKPFFITVLQSIAN